MALTNTQNTGTVKKGVKAMTDMTDIFDNYIYSFGSTISVTGTCAAYVPPAE